MSKETKQLIAETFVELSRQKSIDKVTVKDVVEACHVSRQTFYYHFQDLTDVMEWMLRQTTEQIWRKVCRQKQRKKLCIYLCLQ